MSAKERTAEDKLNIPIPTPAIKYVAKPALAGKGKFGGQRKKTRESSDSEEIEEGVEKEKEIDVSSDESVQVESSTDEDDMSEIGEHDMLDARDEPSADCLKKCLRDEEKLRKRAIVKTNIVKQKYTKHFRESQEEIKRLKSMLKRQDKTFAGLRKAHTAYKSAFGAALGPHAKGKVVDARASPGGKGKGKKDDSDSEGY
jgi:hypothetical protein